MKSRNDFPARCLSGILLLFVNSVGIAGALTEILAVPWRATGEDVVSAGNGLNQTGFWGGLFLLCAAAVLLWSGSRGRNVFLRVAVCLAVYLLGGVLFRAELKEGIGMALRSAVDGLNGRYGFHIAWQALPVGMAGDWRSDWKMWTMTLSVLYCLFPLELLAGFLGKYDRGFCLIVGNALWFTAACVCDLFPGYFYLAFCVLGAVAAMVQKNFRESPGAGMAAAGCAMVLTGLVMAAVFRFGLPLLDRKYEEIQEGREKFYRMVNEDWIPGIKSLVSGRGPGPDVTGQLGRRGSFAYTVEDVYRVTVDARPQSAVYLKSFVGGTYGDEAWIPQTDGELEDYYRSRGMELPSDYADLVNIGYEALKAVHRGEPPGYMGIEELGGRGSYSIYPYGALLTGEARVHGDGSVERENARYGFQYYVQSGFGRQDILAEDWRAEEENYRRYVCDSFLEYPEERLPLFTEWLEQGEIRRENLYVCVLDIINYLGRQAVYNLDAGNNPAGTDFVEYFLFETREGYCVHFASAAVLALRYFGIPARYVAGYCVSPSEFTASAEGGYTAVLTGKHAHAWAEVYLDSMGWVPVEMTPGAVALAGDNRMEQLGELGRLAGQWVMTAGHEEWQPDRQIWQHEDRGETEPVSGEEGQTNSRREMAGEDAGTDSRRETAGEEAVSRDKNLPADPEKPAEGVPSGEENSPGGLKEVNSREGLAGHPGFRLALFGFWAAFLAALLVCLEKEVLRRRQEKFGKMPPGERIFELYRNLRSILRLAGCPRDLAADGEEFRQILLVQYGVDREEYEAFCGILEKASFSREGPSKEEAGKVLCMYEKLARGACRKAPAYKKPLIQRYRLCVRG